MSVVTEYFVASADDVGKIFSGWRWGTGTIPPPSAAMGLAPCVVTPDLSGYTRMHLRGVSPTELVTLRGAIGGELAEEADRQILRPHILAPPIAGRTQWVHAVPDELVHKIGELSSETEETVGVRWAELEQSRLATIEDEAVRRSRLAHHRPEFWQDMLAEIVTLARIAVERDQGLYLYIHL